MDFPVRITPGGGMDADSLIKEISRGNYTDAARNIRHKTTGGNTSGPPQNILGNEFSYSIGEVTPKNKQVLIAVNTTTDNTADITFRTSANGIAYIASGITIPGGDIETAIDNIVSDCNTVLAAYGGVQEIDRTIDNSHFGNVVIEIGGLTPTTQGIDWIIDVTAPLTFIYVVQEAVSLGLCHPFICIMDLDINLNLFQAWTTQQHLPESHDVYGASNTTPIRITESAAHGLADGDLVSLSGILRNTNANGMWLVDVISTTEYDLIGSAGNGDAALSIINGAQYFSTTEIIITTAAPHGMITGDRVYITGVHPEIEGIWTIQVRGADTMVLVGSFFVANFGVGSTVIRITEAIHYPVGLGEIGVSERSQGGTWTYTRLLRSTELDFRAEKQIDVRGEIQNTTFNLYFTDDYNNPRTFYYTGEFVTDGAINYINSNGLYSYGTIAEQLVSIIPFPIFDVRFDLQNQLGGLLTSGNWWYVFRLVTESFETTGWGNLTNAVNVFAPVTSDPVNILGNIANTSTPKSNQFTLSGINQSYYKYVDVGAINGVDGSFTGQQIGRYTISVGGDVTFTHTGTESGATDLDLTLLNQLIADIQTAKNIELLDNRLIYSNTTSSPEYDLEDWAQTSNYSLLKKTIQGTGAGYENPVLGEYQDPVNVFYFAGGMRNEMYRMGIKLRNKKTGTWTRNYFMLDFVMDNSAATGRRLVTLADFDLTNTPTPPANAEDVYVYYIQFENFDWDYLLPDGKRIRDVYDYFEITRSPVINPLVLGEGLIFTLVTGNFASTGHYDFCLDSVTTLGPGVFTTPFVAYPYAANDPFRQTGIMYFPDVIFGGKTINYVTGDLLYTYGQPLYQHLVQTGVAVVSDRLAPKLLEFYGNMDSTYTAHTLDSVVNIVSEQEAVVNGVPISGYFSQSSGGATIAAVLNTLAFNISGSFINDTAGLMADDHGVYQAQYIRPTTDPYGDSANTKYIGLNAIFPISSSSSISTTYDVYLNDCFTQKSYVQMAPPISGTSNNWGKIWGFYSQNRVNAQMRNDTGIASQYVYPKGVGSNASPYTRIEEVTSIFNTEPLEYNKGYNIGTELLITDIAYNTLFPVITDQPNRAWYSATKPSGSLTDYYRIILPLNFYDENNTGVEIIGMWVIGTELYFLMYDGIYREFFNTRGEFQGGDLTPTIVVGSGTVFSQRGVKKSNLGCQHKWAQIKGKSQSGHDTLYWLNANLKKVVRFGQDGTQVISEDDISMRRRMRSWFDNNLNFAAGNDTPAAGNGICMGWDSRYSQLYITVKVQKDTSQYISGTTYSLGDIVKYTPDLYERNFEQTGEIYIYINNSSSTNVPTNTDYWTKIEHSNNEYYNEYTLMYDEDRNTWECFMDFKPTIYLEWGNKILTPRPVGNTFKVYEHDRGYYCRWYVDEAETLGSVTKDIGSTTVTGTGTSFFSEFQVHYGIRVGSNTFFVISVASDTVLTIDDIYIDVNGDVQTGATDIDFTGAQYIPVSQQMENGYCEAVLNIEPLSSKNFGAIEADTLTIPYRIDLTTNTQVSYLEQDDFEFREDFYYSTLKNESGSTGLNSNDTSRLYGQWLKVKLAFRYLIQQTWNNAVVKSRVNQRNYNK